MARNVGLAALVALGFAELGLAWTWFAGYDRFLLALIRGG